MGWVYNSTCSSLNGLYVWMGLHVVASKSLHHFLPCNGAVLVTIYQLP
uniref:Uncharacterized protein n=1 Tax=Arundo donax TaxID=35708 RepID=A0A0A9H7Y7_ARUDO